MHYLTDPTHVFSHEFYKRLYYAPIILSAYFYGAPGGFATAVLSSVAYLPFIQAVWADNQVYAANLYVEVIVFYLIGLSVGFLASAQRRLTRRYHAAASSLEHANKDLADSYEQLLRANRLSALGEVAAGLTHEIRNPLASVKGALEIIRSRVQTGTPEAEFSSLASAEVSRLEALVGTFLDYARPSRPERRRVRMNELVERVVVLLTPEAEKADVTLDVSGVGDNTEIDADPAQLEQVLLNVVLNAIQANPLGSRVSIVEGRAESSVVLDVIDQGPGIPDHDRSRIFEPFFTTKKRGTGLGLAITQRIISAHGGTIEALADEVGTHMRISLPVAHLTESGQQPS